MLVIMLIPCLYDESQGLARVDTRESPLPQTVGQFTIAFDKKSVSMADLNPD